MEIVIQSAFIFRIIGQGLFYTGKIKGFIFVYDYSTESGGDVIKNAIKEFQNELTPIVNQLEVKKALDLLVISHFDRDHINGLPDLLKNFQVYNVDISYLYPIERLKVASRNIRKS
ncbi:hypothetical protein [Bacillus thuringiensis]|uniref:hypothetical protein n=1 Tax=Bacillus thuringiensis TaxID=1428 RepID=UPI000CD8FE9E|nr:hypothetical protein [Bacillus thuringiensis]QFQ28500.1 hypothetical protein DDE73_27750 [Bacillus thuringiensis]